MEYLLPLAIVIGLVLAFLLLRRPNVTQLSDGGTRGTTNPAVTGASPQVRDEALRAIMKQVDTMPPGAVKVLWKGNTQIHWTLDRGLNRTSLSGQELVVGNNQSADQLAEALLSKLITDSAATNAPDEARLQYPDSKLILTQLQDTHSTSGGWEHAGGVHKMTLASPAECDQIGAWYRDWLLSHGWQPSSSPGPTAISSYEYVRGTEHFRLALSEPSTVAPFLPVPIPEDAKTVFEVEYSNSSGQVPPAST